MTEQQVNEILRRNYGFLKLPNPVRWTLLVGTIRNYQREPWTNHDAGVLTAAVRKMQRERVTLDAAAKILEADAKRFFQGNEEWQRRYAEAIQMLRLQRGAADNRRDHVAKISDKGPSITGWAYVARQIMGCLVPVLANADRDENGKMVRAVLPVSSRYSSPFVKSLRELLGKIYPSDKLPSAATLSQVVADYLDK